MKSIRSLKPKGGTLQLDLNSLVEGGLGQSWEHLLSPNVAWVQFLDLTSRAGRVYWFSVPRLLLVLGYMSRVFE